MKSRTRSKLTPVSEILKRTQQNRTQHIFVITHLRKKWNQVVGGLLASQTDPKKILRNVLWVSVESSSLSYELTLMKEKILENIRSLVKYPIKDVRFAQESFARSDFQSVPSRKKFTRTQAEPDESLASILDRVRELSGQLRK